MSIKHNGINNWEYSVEGALSFLSKTVKKNIIMHLFTCLNWMWCTNISKCFRWKTI
ncbi:hypothetical protein ONA22_00580 [Mycoplasmopsis cynos]|uniref:hypothetical protein n=1 Tax=Mycoplasmopsis cynos TaxID=171284 RepID=UPI0024C65519|nr:hypothetical protein [Mycoplasmopsis cynos]WAM03567.1 hypothetical protein ONA22_00580 [Mycoplasmopsis cynos]